MYSRLTGTPKSSSSDKSSTCEMLNSSKVDQDDVSEVFFIPPTTRTAFAEGQSSQKVTAHLKVNGAQLGISTWILRSVWPLPNTSDCVSPP